MAAAALVFLAGSGALMAQSAVTVNATPVNGEKNTYTLAIAPYSAGMETALNDLKVVHAACSLPLRQMPLPRL